MPLLLRTLLVVFGLWTALLAGTVTAARHDQPGLSWIALSADPFVGSRSGMFRAYADGSHIQALGEGRFPTWSPDGHWIAYERAGSIYRVNFWGRHRMRLAARMQGNNFRNPKWSPDGQWIVFRDNTDLYIIRPRGGHVTRLVTDIREVLFWSLDSQWIYFIDRGDRFVARVRVDGSQVEYSVYQIPAWEGADLSPDGQWIAYAEFPSATSGGIFVIRADGSDRRQIVSARHREAFWNVVCCPAWTPQGDRITFLASVYHGGQTFTIRSDGSDLRRFPGSLGPRSGDWVEIRRPLHSAMVLASGFLLIVMGIAPWPQAIRWLRQKYRISIGM